MHNENLLGLLTAPTRVGSGDLLGHWRRKPRLSVKQKKHMKKYTKLQKPPFKNGQLIRNKTTGDIMQVMTATKLGVSAVPAIVLGVFIHPAGYQNYEVA